MTTDRTTATTTGEYAEVNGQRLYYEIHGTGPPLVLIHGGVSTIDLTFGELLEPLAADHQVIALELQGHGHTPDTDREYSLVHLADDVAALLDHLGIERADAFGFSLGGLTIEQLMVSHPERIGRAVVASAHFRHEGYHDWVFSPPSADGQDDAWLPTEDDFAEMRSAYERVAPDPDHFFDFMAKPSGMVAAFEGWSDDAMRSISSPTLVVVGDRDFVRLEHAVEMYELIPDSALAVLPNTTHVGVIRDADTLLPILRSFLGG